MFVVVFLSGISIGYFFRASFYIENSIPLHTENSDQIFNHDLLMSSNIKTKSVGNKQKYSAYNKHELTITEEKKSCYITNNWKEFNENSNKADGLIALQQGNYETARIIFEENIKDDQTNIEFLQYLASIYKSEDRLPDYIDMYNNVLAEHPNNIELYGNFANMLASNNPDEATKLLEDGVDKNNNDPKFYYLLADHFIEIGNIESGVHYYREALSLNPNDPWGHFFLGQIYSQIDKGQADIEFEKAASLSIEVEKEIQDYKAQVRM